MSDWSCPLCQLHSPFRTRAMLVYHLNRDHGEVKVSWAEINIRSTRRWRLMFVLPDHEGLTEPIPDEDEDEDDVGRGNEMYMKEEVTSEEAEESHLGSSASPIAPHFREPLFLPGSDDEESPAPVTPPQFPEVVEEFKPKLDRVSATPEDRKSLLSASVPPTQQSRATTFSATRFSYRGSLPARYPSPPPPDDRLGPAAQYPYLPETNDDQPIYSCRIGGPRIYDLLNELPLDEFGVMSWAVVDREEELFEMEDVRDEDKVMLALWNRWIMLNKSSFIFNDYDKGVQKFLDCYWQMIHRAAGWRALRAFLMMLQVNKYLTLTKVIAALKYYEEKIGMELWYKDAQEETA
ncbi:hypothetical protein BD414DRAFT_415792 [Trametes punicea]|nr:hypothetical protein BD414DRAFT_415792 [Trametes punicea]